MKKEIFTHIVFFISLFLLISVYRSYFELPYVFFWLGGVIGTLIPDLDHLIYIYYLRPFELTSQRAQNLLNRHQFWQTMNLLAFTRLERRHLIFHTFIFQLSFLVFGFLVLSSSGSLLGRGLVIAFMLHLVIDQIIDLLYLGNIQNWLNQFNFNLNKEKTTFYLLFQIIVLLAFGFFF